TRKTTQAAKKPTTKAVAKSAVAPAPKAAAARKHAATKAGPVEVPPPPPAAATSPDAAAAYQRYLPIAQELPADQVTPYRQHPGPALQNINTGLAALVPHADDLAKLPAPFDASAMKELPNIARATMYASAQIFLTSTGFIAQLRKTAGALRDILLS